MSIEELIQKEHLKIVPCTDFTLQGTYETKKQAIHFEMLFDEKKNDWGPMTIYRDRRLKMLNIKEIKYIKELIYTQNELFFEKMKRLIPSFKSIRFPRDHYKITYSQAKYKRIHLYYGKG